jgi:Flp pilus assembly protein TadD
MRETLRRRWPVYLATFSSWIPLAGLMYFLPRTSTVGATADASVLQYALNQSVLIVQYLRLALWPDRLLIDYGKPWDVSLLEAAPCVVAVIGLMILTVAAYRRLPAAGYLGAWVFLLLAPTSSVIPINTEVGAERRMYLPLAAVVVLAVWGVRVAIARLCRFAERRPGVGKSFVIRRAAVVHGLLLACAAAALSARTIDRNSDYANPLKLWTQAVEEVPRNRRAWVNLADQFRRVAPQAAALVSEEIIRRWPSGAAMHYEVAMHHRYEGNFDRAAHHFRRVAELDPSCLEAQRRLVWLLAACDDDAERDGGEALRIARRLHAQRPESAEMLDALAIAQAECGDFVNAQRNLQRAIEMVHSEGGDTSAWESRLELFEREEPFRFGVR